MNVILNGVQAMSALENREPELVITTPEANIALQQTEPL